MRFFRLPLFLALAFPLFAADFPPAFHIPAGYHELTGNRRHYLFQPMQLEDLGADGKLHPKNVEGELWNLDLRPDDKKGTSEKEMLDLEASLRAAGWTIVRDHGALVAKKSVNSTTAWYRSYPNSSEVTLLDEAPMRRTLTLPPPSATPESVGDKDDYPFAKPFPGGVLRRTEHSTRNAAFTPKGAAQPVVLHVTETKDYTIPKDVSMYEFVHVVSSALEKAGWSIERTAVGSDGTVWAHYAHNGRDIWLYDRASGTEESIELADVGVEASTAALKAELAKNGHAALYGIYFDTDSATPKPESETTLRHVLQLLQAEPSLRLEIQGHTDNSGSADHNIKLSDQRAASVRTWLTAHGIAAARLTSKGYGATKPVADNNTAEGKAKNRRVELVKL